MKKQIFNPRNLALFSFMLAVAASRILVGSCEGSLINFTPICAMGLFGGAYFKGFKAFVFPLLTLWLSDILLSKLFYYHEWRLFYQDFYWTYGAFALMVVAGKLIRPNQSLGRFSAAMVAAVLIHWVVTDFGVWAGGLLFPRTLSGWFECMAVAVPYELPLMGATIVYGAIMFGTFEWLQKRVVQLQPAIN